MNVSPEDVDIRLAVGEPRGETPIKLTCPPHIHKERIGMEDEKGSLAVYRKNVHCFGCGFHITRRYASLAFLLGEWDGRGRESSERVREAVRRVKRRLPEFLNHSHTPRREFVPPLDPRTAEAFHQYLLCYGQDRLLIDLQRKRGLSLATVKKFRLGYTGTHFTIPVYGLSGALYTIRYRADERVTDTNGGDYRKYEGTWGRNAPVLFPLPVVRGLHALDELWVVEGEFDAIASNQAGSVTLTVTNGATNLGRVVALIAAQLPSLIVSRWVLATDQDGAGERAAALVMEKLTKSGQSAVRARWGGVKDLTEHYARGGKREEIWYEDVFGSVVGREGAQVARLALAHGA